MTAVAVTEPEAAEDWYSCRHEDTMTPEQAIAMWGTYEGLAAVSAGLLLGFIAARLLRRTRCGIGELTRVDAKNGVVSMAMKNTQGLKAGDRVRLVLMGGLAVLLLAGCVGSFEEARLAGVAAKPSGATPAPPSEYCQSLDSQRRWWGGAGQGAAALAGAQGLVAIPVESDRVELGLAIGGAAMGAASVGALWVSNDAGETWARDCAGGRQ